MHRRWPEANVHAIDFAPGMIRQAQQLDNVGGRVTWMVADAATYHGELPYDLVMSNCALHWLYPFRAGMQNLLGQLSATGRLVMTIMLDGTLSELHAARLRAAPLKPPAGRLPAFDEVLDVLRESGLTIGYASEEIHHAHLPQAEDVLRMVHELGLSGGHVSRSHTPLHRGELAALVRDYDFNFRAADGSVPVTYHVGFFVARRGPS
jgi:trans-aconitate methyltransferase